LQHGTRREKHPNGISNKTKKHEFQKILKSKKIKNKKPYFFTIYLILIFNIFLIFSRISRFRFRFP
jgi:hypothetical protein